MKVKAHKETEMQHCGERLLVVVFPVEGLSSSGHLIKSYMLHNKKWKG